MVSSRTAPAEDPKKVKPEDKTKVAAATPAKGDSQSSAAPAAGPAASNVPTPGASGTAAAGAPAPGAPVVRKGPSAKEVIPFQWKLLGECRGVILTLFKAVERDEVEAQYERLSSDGYYGKLRIAGAEEKVKQRASAKSALVPGGIASGKTKPKTGKSPRKMMAKWAKESGEGKRRTAQIIASAPPPRVVKKTKPTKTTTKAAKTSKVAKVSKVVKSSKAAAKATKDTSKPSKTRKVSKAVKSSKAAKSATKAKPAKKATVAKATSKSRKKTVRAKSSSKPAAKSPSKSAAKPSVKKKKKK